MDLAVLVGGVHPPPQMDSVLVVSSDGDQYVPPSLLYIRVIDVARKAASNHTARWEVVHWYLILSK